MEYSVDNRGHREGDQVLDWSINFIKKHLRKSCGVRFWGMIAYCQNRNINVEIKLR